MIRNTEYPWTNQTNFNWQYFCIWIKRTVNERYAKMKIYRYINQTKFKINLFARCYVIVYIDWLPDCRYFMHVVNLYTHATRTLTNVYTQFSQACSHWRFWAFSLLYLRNNLSGKRKYFLKKLEYRVLVGSTMIENTILPYKTTL